MQGDFLLVPASTHKIRADVDWDGDLLDWDGDLPHLIEWASSDETVAKFSSTTVDSRTALFTIMGVGDARIIATWITADDVKCMVAGVVRVYHDCGTASGELEIAIVE